MSCDTVRLMGKHVVAAVSELPPGSRRLINVRGRPIAVFNLEREFYAVNQPNGEFIEIPRWIRFLNDRLWFGGPRLITIGIIGTVMVAWLIVGS